MGHVSGLTHLHLVVADVERSVRFYEALGMERSGDKDGGALVFLGTPGGGDLLTLSDGSRPADVTASPRKHIGHNGGIDHFGFTLVDQLALPAAVEAVAAAGGSVIRVDELAPGWPTAFLRDPDGYAFQF